MNLGVGIPKEPHEADDAKSRLLDARKGSRGSSSEKGRLKII